MILLKGTTLQQVSLLAEGLRRGWSMVDNSQETTGYDKNGLRSRVPVWPRSDFVIRLRENVKLTEST